MRQVFSLTKKKRQTFYRIQKWEATKKIIPQNYKIL